MNGGVRLRRLLLPVLVTVSALGVVAGVAQAHSGVESSVPKSGSTVDEPIDEVFIEFGVRIADDVEIALLDPDEVVLPSETERVSQTAAKVHFDPLVEKGTYIARYLTTEPDAGHILAGAISFNYGEASSDGTSVLMWLVVGIGCVAILAVGAWMSLRKHRAASSTADGDDADLPARGETPLTGPSGL